MVYVSYTRAVQGFGDAIPLSEQSEAVKEFCKAKKIQLEKKYSDRKQKEEADEAFVQLTEDAVARRFDCVVFYSTFTLGTGPLKANDLLALHMVPAGLDFISVFDGFISYEHSKDEVISYLAERKALFLSLTRRNNALTATNAYINTKQKYGYLRNENGIEIDEEVEPVVKSIFKMFLAGTNASEIARILNKDNVMSFGMYFKQKFGIGSKPSVSWQNTVIRSILTDSAYSGKWEVRDEKSQKMYVDCPAYITAEEHANILQKTVRVRRNSQRYSNVFSNLIVDEETGLKLCTFLKSKKKNPRRLFSFYSMSEHPDYELTEIEYNEVYESVIEQLNTECKDAKKVQKFLETKQGKEAVKQKTEALRNKLKSLFSEMRTVVDELMPDACAGSVTAEQRMNKLDSEFIEVQGELETIKTIFSENNPWINLYLGCEVDRLSKPKDFKKYIEVVCCRRFKNVTAVFKEQEYKQAVMKLLEE